MYYVRMTDKFMSGWGRAQGKTNVLVIICETYNQALAIRSAAMKRPEMKRVRIVASAPRQRPGVLLSFKNFSELGGPWLEFHAPKTVDLNEVFRVDSVEQ